MSLTPAIQAALAAVNQVAGVSIVYTRNGEHTVTLTATVGRTMYEKETSAGVFVKVQLRDYVNVPAASLILNGQTVLPEPGDKITEEIAGETLIFEVVPHGDNAWRYMDPGRTLLRIHTQQVGVEPEEEEEEEEEEEP